MTSRELLTNERIDDMAKLKTSTSNQPGLTATVGGIGGAIPFLNVFAPGLAAAMGAEDERAVRQLMADNAAGVETPGFDRNPYERQTYAGDFDPKLFDDPELAQATTAKIDPKLRAAQLSAIEQLASMGDGAAAAGFEADRKSGIYDAEVMARGMNESLEQEAASRGMGGGAGELGRRAAANGSAANRASRSGLEAARQKAIMQMASAQAEEGALGRLRGQDQQLEMSNTEIVNAFNQQAADATNRVRMGNVQMQNDATRGNLDGRQQVMNANTTTSNASKDRGDHNVQQDWQNRFAQMQAVNAALSGSADQQGRNVEAANAAGKQGYGNFKDLMSFMGGGAGGVKGNPMGGGK